MSEKDIFEKNELTANKSMAIISAVMAGVLFIFWLLIMLGVNAFSFTQSTIRYVQISCPIDILFLITPFSIKLAKPELLKKTWFKYFVTSLLILAVAAINMVLPKDGVMLWAAVIAVAALYFSPKVTKFAFIFAAILMLVVTPLSTIFGAWESNVMCTTEEEFVKYMGSDGITPLNPDSRSDRIYWLNNFNEITGKSEINRWIAMFVFYFLPRFIIFSIIFALANSLSKRTKSILFEEAEEAKNIQKMMSELNIARAIQSACLPNEFPNSSRCELFAMMDPAKEVGGDFYDFFKIDHDHAALVIGDVSGKGVPASLFMMKTQAIINALANSIKDNPSEILERANEAVCKGNDMNMFVTCWLGILDLNTGELNYVSAGHNPPVIKKDGQYEYLKGKSGLVLGVYEGVKYVTNTIKLKKGDKLFIYTDGVTEAHNKDNQLYGEERLLNFFKDEDPAPASGIVKVRESVRQFSSGTEQFDDITMLMVEYHKSQSVFMKKFITTKDSINNVFAFINESLKFSGLDDEHVDTIKAVVEKVYSSFMNNAGEDNDKVDIAISYQDHSLNLIFVNTGKAFNPINNDESLINLDVNNKDASKNVLIIKNIMDEVYYEYREDKNILSLVKKF